MITPDEIYMYNLPYEERKAIIDLLADQGYHIRWDYNIVTDTSDLIYLESHGLWYDADQLKTCSCCGKQYLVQEEPHHHGVYDEETDEYVNFCSEVCLKDGGYVKYSDGSIHYRPEVGQRVKAHYKSTTKVSDASEEHPFLIGLEIEKEDQESYNKMYYGEGLKSPKGWLYVHDGSLKSDCGLELVSHGYNLTREKKEMLQAIDSCSDFINGTSSSRCGGHISISEHGKTSKELLEEIRPLVCLMLALFPNRMRNNKINKMTFSECVNSVSNNKYKPVTVNANGRVELRMISRVKSVNSLKRRIEVIQWFLENKPTFKQTKESMKNGFLKNIMSAVYGTESWDEKISIFDKMSLWFCWNVNPNKIEEIMDNDS